MSKQAGPTEARVRGALLGMLGRREDAFSVSSASLRAEVMRDGEGPVSIESVRRVGRPLSKGEWLTLSDAAEYTYSRGVFTVRRKWTAEDAAESLGSFMLRDKRAAVGEPDADGYKDRAPLDTPENPDLTIQVTWRPGDERRTALVTVRAKDQDLTPAQLRSFASALSEAAADITGEPDEPRVTQRHLDLMRVATGGRLSATRNYFCPKDGQLREAWSELVSKGLAGEGEPPDASNAGDNKGRVFHVTEAGFRMTYGDVRKPGKRGRGG